jgi:hypothetical protein
MDSAATLFGASSLNGELLLLFVPICSLHLLMTIL